MRALPLRRTAAVAAGAALAASAMTAFTGPARADDDPPVPAEVNDFSDCPAASDLPVWSADEASSWICTVAVVVAGRLKLGKIDQEITSPIKITYAIGDNFITGEERVVQGPLRSTPLRVPGGVLGIPGTDFIPLLQISAQPELTAPLQFNPGDPTDRAAVTMKLRVKVLNPLLGDSCYIGSAQKPVALRLGYTPTNPPPPNTPIEGIGPHPLDADPSVLDTTMVDNEFAVPQSSGCGIGGILNGIADWRAGLPSPAGNNTAVLRQYAKYQDYTFLAAKSAKFKLKSTAKVAPAATAATKALRYPNPFAKK
ncbi:hypothetical protein [Actinomadura parmotrematis]|uniref:Secreted protein n=1 Tax=Actinomadura parmotrematis TaxID=2864039 RepID=A0ABS7G549_9ACTN|nr:hypothetical protein [Actinomadura parmotrematis]MBW8487586.1 hypothetical protein [Actinomadura parmotrematis]